MLPAQTLLNSHGPPLRLWHQTIFRDTIAKFLRQHHVSRLGEKNSAKAVEKNKSRPFLPFSPVFVLVIAVLVGVVEFVGRRHSATGKGFKKINSTILDKEKMDKNEATAILIRISENNQLENWNSANVGVCDARLAFI